MFTWTILEKEFCTKTYPNLILLIVVYTAMDHVQQRQIYRDMYAEQFFENYGVALLFALGTSRDSRENERIAEESAIYHDIIQQDFLDVYRNLTWKTLSWLKFIDEYCESVQYILKMDDDVVFDLFALIKYLKIGRNDLNNIQRQKQITCSVMGGKPHRDPSSKWYVTKEEYEADFYHAFCSGPLYVMPRSIAIDLLYASFGEKFFWLEDYFVTGHLAHKLNITFDNIASLHGSVEQLLNRETILCWGLDMKEVKKIWNELRMKYAIEDALKKDRDKRRNSNEETTHNAPSLSIPIPINIQEQQQTSIASDSNNQS